MTSLDRIRRDLEDQRRQLLDQLAAVDAAIAALAVPVRVKPRRVLTDSHKQKLTAGRRRAREVKDAASGIAREMPDDSFVPAIGKRGDRQAPRLIKRPREK